VSGNETLIGPVRQCLEAMLAATSWDTPPSLHCLYFDGHLVRPGGLEIVPSEAWADEPPEVVLAKAAQHFGASSALSLVAIHMPTLCGVAFSCETWNVHYEPGSAEETEVRRMESAGVLHLHPDRVEERWAWAATRQGMVAQARPKDGVVYQVPGPTGDIPVALTGIWRSMWRDLS
jgi:hypothetical protein